MSLLSKAKRFVANDKKTYARLQAQRHQRDTARDRVLDERLEEGFPSGEVMKGWGWTSLFR